MVISERMDTLPIRCPSIVYTASPTASPLLMGASTNSGRDIVFWIPDRSLPLMSRYRKGSL